MFKHTCRSDVYNQIAKWSIKLAVAMYSVYFVLMIFDVKLHALTVLAGALVVFTPLVTHARDRNINEEEKIIRKLKGIE